jgi:hypothetical protein
VLEFMQYRKDLMQLERIYKTHHTMQSHARGSSTTVNHRHLRSQADFPRSIYLAPDHRRCHLCERVHGTNQSRWRVSNISVRSPTPSMTRETQTLTSSLSTELAMDPAIIRLNSTASPPRRAHYGLLYV